MSMNRYDFILNKKSEKKREVDTVRFKTKVYNKDIDVNIKVIDPKPGDVLFIETNSLDHERLIELNNMVRDVVGDQVKLICTNTSLNIQHVKARKDHAVYISAPQLSPDELKEFQQTIRGELGDIDYKVIVTDKSMQILHKEIDT